MSEINTPDSLCTGLCRKGLCPGSFDSAGTQLGVTVLRCMVLTGVGGVQ